MTTRNILVCGTGNASHVLVARLGVEPSWHVSLFSLSSRGVKFANTIQNTRLICDDDDAITEASARVQLTADDVCIHDTTDAANAAKDADMIILAIPAYAHEGYLRALLPFCKDNVIILMIPSYAFGDLLVRQLVKTACSNMEGRMFHVICSDELPWVCRTFKFGEYVRIFAHKEKVDFSAITLSDGEFKSCSKAHADMFSQLMKFMFKGNAKLLTSPTASFAMSLRNPNALMHTSLLSGFYESKDSIGFTQKAFEKPPVFYNEPSTETINRLNAVSDEVIQIRDEICRLTDNWDPDLSSVESFYEWIQNAYPHTTADNSSTESCLRTNDATQSLVHPMIRGEDGLYRLDCHHRYLLEDVPYALLAIVSVAQVVGVKTPNIEKIVRWAQQAAGRDWLDEDGQLTPSCLEPPARTLHRFEITHFDELKTLYNL